MVVGVEHFYLYNNDSTDSTRDILLALDRHGLITYKDWPSVEGKNKQVSAYNDFFASKSSETEWIAVVDGDEFIVPTQGHDLREMMTEFEQYGGVAFNWRVFGSGGAEEFHDDLVIRRFKRASLEEHPANYHLKSIVKPQLVASANVHVAILKPGFLIVDEHHNSVDIEARGLHTHISFDKVQINHYFTKSKAEWEAKRLRGRGAVIPGAADSIRPNSMFNAMDLNDVEDDKIQRFLPEIEEKLTYLRSLTRR